MLILFRLNREMAETDSILLNLPQWQSAKRHHVTSENLSNVITIKFNHVVFATYV